MPGFHPLKPLFLGHVPVSNRNKKNKRMVLSFLKENVYKWFIQAKKNSGDSSPRLRRSVLKGCYSLSHSVTKRKENSGRKTMYASNEAGDLEKK